MITSENAVQRAEPTEKNAKYDIIIPNWNNAEYAVPCLESIKKYTKDY